MVTRRPRLDSRAPRELAVSPLPREDTTPPVTKTYFVGWELWRSPSSRVPDGRSTGNHRNTIGAVPRPGRGRAVGHVVPGGARTARRRGGPDQQGHQQRGGRGGHRDPRVVDRRAEGQGQRYGEQSGTQRHDVGRGEPA